MAPSVENGTAARIAAFIIALVLALGFAMFQPVSAEAAIYVGDEEIEMYEPNDIISTDMEINAQAPNEVADKLENGVVKLIKVAMPFLMIGCVAIIVGNGFANIFRPKEKRVFMGDIIKNMLVQFFFILFAFIIVEGIVFVVTGGQTILLSAIMS